MADEEIKYSLKLDSGSLDSELDAEGEKIRKKTEEIAAAIMEIVNEAGEDVKESFELVSKSMLEFIENSEEASEAMKGLLNSAGKSEDKNPFEAIIGGVGTLITNIGTATKAQKIFNATAKSNPYLFAATVIMTLLSAITNFASASKAASEEMTKKAGEAAKSAQKEAESLKDLKDQYLEIADGTDSVAEKEKALVEWKQKLIDKYGYEKDALDKINLSRQSGIDLMDQEIEKSVNKGIADIGDNYQKAVSAIENNSDNYVTSTTFVGSVEQINDDIAALEKLGFEIERISDMQYNLNVKGDNVFEMQESTEALIAYFNVKKQNNKLNEAEKEALTILETKHKDLSKVIETNGELYKNGNELYAQSIILQSKEEIGLIKTQASYELYKNKIMESAGASEGLKASLEEQINELFPQFSKETVRINSDYEAQAYYAEQAASSSNNLGESFDEMGDAASQTNDLLEEQANQLKGYESTISSLNGYIQILNNGSSLNAEQVKSLIELYPELTSQVTKTADGYTIEASALETIRDTAANKAADIKASQMQETLAVLTETSNRLKLYQTEIAGIKSVADAEDLQTTIAADRRKQALAIGSDSDVQQFNKSGKDTKEIQDKLQIFIDTQNKIKDLTNDIYKNIGTVSDAEDNLASSTSKLAESQTESFEKWSESANTFADNYNAEMDKIISKRDELQQKLESYGSLFTMEKDSDDSEDETMKLSDIDENTSKLKGYQQNIEETQEKLKKLGLPKEFMQEIISLGVDEGSEFSETLNELSDTEFKNYIEKWKENKELAKEIAEEFYADEISTLKDGYFEKLNELVKAMPEQMNEIGIETIEGFIQGMKSKLGEASDMVGIITDAVVEKFGKKLEINSPSKVLRKIGNYTTEGFVAGIGDGKGEVDEAVGKLLSSVSAKDINGQFQQAFDFEIGGISADIISGGSSGGLPDSASGNFTYTQNNYSPMALTRSEIYRNTQQMLQLMAGKG